MFILALVHAFPFIIVLIQKGDMMYAWKNEIYYWTGVAALVPQAWLNITLIGPIRYATTLERASITVES
jgi:hypothetical protein